MRRRTARALIVRDGQALLMERWRRDSTTGEQLHYFSFLGGTVEEDESLEQTVVREIDEEAAVMIVVKQLVATQTTATEEHNYFWCEYVSGEPRLREDSVEALRAEQDMNMYLPTWVPLSEVTSETLHPVFRPVLPLLKDLAAGQTPSKVWQF